MPRPISLTLRDIDVILFVHRFEGACTDHLRLRFWPSTARTTIHSRLSRLIKDTYLQAAPLRSRAARGGGQFWLTLGPAARPVLEHHLKLTVAERWLRAVPIVANWKHDLECRFVRLCLELATERSGLIHLEDWWTERALRRQVMTVLDTVSRDTVELVPDGSFLLLMEGHRARRFHLELDRATESAQRVQPRLRGYLQSGEVTTLFVVPHQARARQLLRWVDQAARQIDVDPGTIWIAQSDAVTPRSIIAEAIWETVDGARHALVDRLVGPQIDSPSRVSSPEGQDDLNLQ